MVDEQQEGGRDDEEGAGDVRVAGAEEDEARLVPRRLDQQRLLGHGGGAAQGHGALEGQALLDGLPEGLGVRALARRLVQVLVHLQVRHHGHLEDLVGVVGSAVDASAPTSEAELAVAAGDLERGGGSVRGARARPASASAARQASGSKGKTTKNTFIHRP